MSFSDLVKKANEKKDDKEEKKKSSFSSLVKKAYSGNVGTRLNSTQVTEWGNSVKDVIDRAYKYLSTDKYSKADSSLADEISRYASDADDVLQYLRANKSKIDDYDNVYNSYFQMTDAIKKYQKSIESRNELLSQFESEDDYNKWYNAYTEKLEMVNSENGKKGWEKYLTDKEASKKAAEKKKSEESLMDKIGRWMGSGGPIDTTLPMGTTTAVTNAYRDGAYVDLDREPNDRWSEEQKLIFGYKYMENPSEAYAYAREINEYIDMVTEDEALKKIAESAASGFWSGVGNTIGAIATAPLGMADFLSDLVEANATGTISSHDGIVSPFEYSQAVTGGISSHLNEKSGVLDERIPIIGGKGLGDVYGLGTSVAQSMASAYTLGSAGTLISYFGQGAASGVDEALSRGATDEQAILYGVSLGTFEGLAEMVGVDKLFKLGSSSTVKGFIKNILNQAGAEGMEEGLTSLLSNIADNVIMQDKSNFSFLVAQYMAQGMSESEAKKKAWMASVEGIAYDTIAGAVSGGVSGGIHTTAQNIAEKQAVKNHGQDIIQEGGVDTLKQLALDMAGVTQKAESKNLTKLAEKVESNPSAKNVGKLSAQLENSITSQNRADIQKSLVEKGLSEKEAKRVSEYLGGVEEVTEEQRKEIRGNEKIKAVVTELIEDPKSTISERGRKLVAARLGIKLQAETSGELSLNKEVDLKSKISKSGKTTVTKTENGKQTVSEATIDKKNPIAKNVDGTVYLNTDKGVVKSSEVNYANETEGLLYEAFSDMNPAFANAVIRNYDNSVPIQTYINGMREGMIVYGMHNFKAVGADISKNSFLADLSEADQAFALKLGRAYAKADAKNANKDLRSAIKKAAEKAKASEEGSTSEAMQNKPKKGNVYFEDGAKAETHKQHKKIISLSKHLAKAIGIDIVFYDSRITGKKAGQGANGYYDADTDTIYLDLQNAHNDAKTIAYTLSHELVHFIKKWSPQKFNTFAEFLMEQYASHGVSAANLLKQKMVELNTTDADFAYEEMIADACETMLLDSNAVVKLMELRKNDLELFEKIKLHLLKILNDIREAYKKLGYQPSSDEAKALLGMKDVLEKFYAMFEDAAVDAAKTYQALGTEGYNELVAEDSNIKKQAKNPSTGNSVFTEEEMLNIRKDVVTRFNLKGINGFAQVQRNVLNTLKANGFFESNGERKVVIKENGMVVTVNRGSIDETFGNGSKYELIPAAFKILKLATIEQIPSIIENATVVVENEKNKYGNGKNKAFTYLSGTATIEGKSVPVRVTLKISKEKNKFWVHHVDVIKNADDTFGLGAKNASPTDSKVSPAEGSISHPNDSVKKQLKKTSDTEYLDAVNRGDMETAQRMVDEAAKSSGAMTNENGLPTRFYHGSESDFNEFSYGKIGEATGVGILGDGFYFADNKNTAKAYGKNVRSFYLQISNPYTASENDLYLLKTQRLIDTGYDGVVMETPKGKIVMAFDNNQIKSADPVTYDDNGNVIPLSERFNSEKSDIRYQKKKTSNRALLSNALESTVTNDIEKNKLAQYKEKISQIKAEEQKLFELRSEIKELSFAKGPRDVAKIKKLQFEANQTANRINTYDRQLLNLESTTALKGVLEREKQKAYKKAQKEGKEALEAYREKMTKTQQELLTRYQESRKKGIEGRRKTEMRHKIKTITSELDTLLRNPTSKKHIKEELRAEVADALLAINMDTVGADERVAHYNEMIAKAKDPDIIAELTKTRDRIQLQGDNLKEKLANLHNAYEKIKATEDIGLKFAYQEVIRNSIEAVSKEVGDTSIRNMTLEQLEMVYDLFKMIRQTIRNANKAFNEQKGQTIMQMAEAVNDQVRTVGGQPYKHNVISDWLQREGWHLLKPYVAFRTIGSVTLTNLYKELRNGEDTFYNDVKEAQAFIEEQYEKHGYKSWDMKKTKPYTAKSGKTFDLTLEQRMTLYAYYQREKAHKHIIEGGIVFEDALITEKNKLGVPIKYKVTTKDAFNLSEETFADIAQSLTEEQKAFVDAMQRYLSVTMGEKGNEVSMEFLGVKLFKEEFYLPIKSSEYYMNFSAEEAGEVKLKSPAFSKETVPHANNPIVLHNFTDLWAEHINDMSMYHSFVLALEDFTRVYNYRTKTDNKVETMDTKATIETAYPGATAYISKFLKDLNGGVRGETVGWAEKLTSLSKKGAVLGSASVAIQQPSAIMRAMAYVNPKYFVMTTLESINLAKHNQDMGELKKYAPIAGIKAMGKFDVGMGQGTVDWIKSNKTAMNIVEDILAIAPEFMDEITWVSIWNAVKRETVHNRKDLRPNSEEFLKVAGERFTEVISLSQVYDSVFSRSDLMRNKSLVAKWLTSFMAEPSTTLNMLWDSYIQGKRTGSKKGFVKTTATAGGAIVASIVLNSALKAIVMAARDDDEDESYVEKYLEHFFGDLKDNLNPLTLIPVVKDVLSIFDGYDVERMDMSLISDLKKAMDAFNSDNKTAYEKWSGLIGAISAMFGVPVKNVERDIRAVINTFFGDAEATTKAGLKDAIEEGWTGDAKSNGQQLYEAMVSGDTVQIERVKGRFKDQNAINSAIRKALRENDPRIKEAAQADVDGNVSEYNRIVTEILDEGNFSEENIKAAIKSEIGKLTENEDVTPSTPKKQSIYEEKHYYQAVSDGNTSLANEIKEDIINTHVANGKDREEAEESFESSFRSYVGKMYKDGEASRSTVSNMLTQYGGYDANETYWKLKEWNFDIENGEDAEYSKYTDFYEAVRTGINIKAVISEYTDHGVKKETLASQITSHYKPLYIKMSRPERASIKGYLLNAYALLGYDRTKKSKDIDKWLED